MTDRAQPGAIDSLIRNDELAQVFGRFSEGFVVPGSDPTPAAQRRGDINETALDAFSLTTSTTSLDVTVAPGEAFISGWVCRDVSTTLTLPANSTVDIVVGFDPDAIFDPQVDVDRDAADETVVDLAGNVDATTPTAVAHRVTTDGSGVTSNERVATVGSSASVNTLEAGTITDGANVSHTGELADSVDVSSIQSSGDVTVEDTQTNGPQGSVPKSQGDGTLVMEAIQAGATVQVDEFTSSGTYNKPSGAALVRARLIGAGGGGGFREGGGGGACAIVTLYASEVPDSVNVSVGSGSGYQEDGGDTAFGDLVTAGGGEGGGGGTSDCTGGAVIQGSFNSPPADEYAVRGGGIGGVSTNGNGGYAEFGGGGGGDENGAGGGSLFGGGGGAGVDSDSVGSGGFFGGDGGTGASSSGESGGSPGTFPGGGGGGAGGSGADGKATIITIL